MARKKARKTKTRTKRKGTKRRKPAAKRPARRTARAGGIDRAAQRATLLEAENRRLRDEIAALKSRLEEGEPPRFALSGEAEDAADAEPTEI